MEKQIFILLICLSIIPIPKSYSCSDQGYYRCNQGYYNWPSSWDYSGGWRTYQCWENHDGTYNHCWHSSGPYYHNRNDNSVTIYRYCHSYCASCDGQNNDNCQSCNSPYNKWVGSDRC